MHSSSVASVLAAALAVMPGAQAAMYTKKSPVLQADAKSFDKLINKSNYTSIVEFYAPWCGHCQNLKPVYEKVAEKLDGLAQVAAVDCDEDANKSLCGSMGVQGFPTLMTVRPNSKPGKAPVVEPYQGARTLSGIANAVSDKINNHVQRVQDKDLDAFLAKSEKPKAILFTDKGTTSALLRSIAIDFLDVIEVAQIRQSSKEAVEKFGITEYPSLVLIPGQDQEAIKYDGGSMEKKALVEFLKQAGEPNPVNQGKSKDKAAKKSSSSSETSTSTSETSTATEAPKPTEVLPESISYEALSDKCFTSKSHVCIIAFVPSSPTETGEAQVKGAMHLNTRMQQAAGRPLPYVSISSDVEGAEEAKKTLGLSDEVGLIATHVRRGWMKKYEGDFSNESLDAWMDLVRMSEGAKIKVPEEIIKDAAPKSEEPVHEEL